MPPSNMAKNMVLLVTCSPITAWQQQAYNLHSKEGVAQETIHPLCGYDALLWCCILVAYQHQPGRGSAALGPCLALDILGKLREDVVVGGQLLQIRRGHRLQPPQDRQRHRLRQQRRHGLSVTEAVDQDMTTLVVVQWVRAGVCATGAERNTDGHYNAHEQVGWQPDSAWECSCRWLVRTSLVATHGCCWV